jgi:hypothetical protein
VLRQYALGSLPEKTVLVSATLQLIEDITPYRHLGIEPPPLHLLINCAHPASSTVRLIQRTPYGCWA